MDDFGAVIFSQHNLFHRVDVFEKKMGKGLMYSWMKGGM